MTIAAAYLTTEGVVFGADSTTTIAAADGQKMQLINHAQKVFEVGESGHLALCTYGAGRVGTTSHRTIAAMLGDFVAKNPGTPIEDIAQQLMNIVITLVGSGHALHGFLGYFFGGCDPSSREPKLFTIQIHNGNVNVQRVGLGPVFGGSFNYFQRVFHGFDPGWPQALSAELKQQLKDVDGAKVDQALNAAILAAAPKFAATGWDDLPIREAVDFVHTYLHITVKVEKFRTGLPACGGPLETAFITTDRKFRWVRHKPFDSAIVEQQNSPR